MKRKIGLITSIRLLFKKDLESTQPINVIHPETVHDKQQLVLERSSDTSDTSSDHFVTIPTKNSFSPLLVAETNPDETICPASNTIQNCPARTGASSDNNKRQQRDSATQTVKKRPQQSK